MTRWSYYLLVDDELGLVVEDELGLLAEDPLVEVPLVVSVSAVSVLHGMTKLWRSRRFCGSLLYLS